MGELTTLLLVHGTGVRQPGYGAAFDLFAERIARIRPKHAVAQCYWGGPHGSRLNARGVTIPSGASHRGVDERLPVSAEDTEVAIWGLLECDPLFELRSLPADEGVMDELPPHAVPSGRELAAAVRELSATPAVASLTAEAGLAGVLPAAVEGVLAAATTTAALRHEATLGATLRVALARAIVADAVLRADEELGGTLPLDGLLRDNLVAAIVAELGGSDRGIGTSLSRFGINVALRLGVTRPMERRRSAITEATAPAAGDVLMYLARGEPIRSFIADTIAATGGRVVIVAHSLGGIASVELLATRALPAVDLLVTVGSQTSLLYELNALPSLPFGAALPATVPRWINIFDPRDLLAFTCEGVFPGRVEDRQVDNGTPFPRSHSAYLAGAGFYAVLDEVLP